MNWLLDPEDQLLYIVAFLVFVLALLFEVNLRTKDIRKQKLNVPHSKRIDKALAVIRKENIKKITNNKWEEITGVSHSTATRDLSHLVELGVLEKKGRGRGVHYTLVRHK